MSNLFKRPSPSLALALAGGISLSLSATAGAQDASSPLSIESEVLLVKTTVAPDGTDQTELTEPTVTVPGDRLIFRTSFSNSGSEPIANLELKDPIPKAVRLSPDADPALIVSVDGGQQWGTLEKLSVREADGSVRPAQHTDVTHIRWVISEVAAGESGSLQYPGIIR